MTLLVPVADRSWRCRVCGGRHPAAWGICVYDNTPRELME